MSLPPAIGLRLRVRAGELLAVSDEGQARRLPDGLYTRAELEQVLATVVLLLEALRAEAPVDPGAEVELIRGEVGSVFASDP